MTVRGATAPGSGLERSSFHRKCQHQNLCITCGTDLVQIALFSRAPAFPHKPPDRQCRRCSCRLAELLRRLVWGETRFLQKAKIRSAHEAAKGPGWASASTIPYPTMRPPSDETYSPKTPPSIRIAAAKRAVFVNVAEVYIHDAAFARQTCCFRCCPQPGFPLGTKRALAARLHVPPWLSAWTAALST